MAGPLKIRFFNFKTWGAVNSYTKIQAPGSVYLYVPSWKPSSESFKLHLPTKILISCRCRYPIFLRVCFAQNVYFLFYDRLYTVFSNMCGQKLCLYIRYCTYNYDLLLVWFEVELLIACIAFAMVHKTRRSVVLYMYSEISLFNRLWRRKWHSVKTSRTAGKNYHK